MPPAAQENWTQITDLESLRSAGQKVVKSGGKQIFLAVRGDTIYACNNRCPHQGFPLSKGTWSQTCDLTCNWHNWKFDLDSGETLIGGDTLRRYRVEVRQGQVWLDLADPPAGQVRAKALANLRQAFDEHDYDRIAREIGRFVKAGGEVVEVVGAAFGWAAELLEFGTTHAHAAAPDWLALRANLDPEPQADRLAPVVEIVGHLAWDCLMQRGPFPLPAGIAKTFDGAALQGAIEAEDQDLATQIARAGLRDGGPAALRDPLNRAALRHYQGFGHSVIFTDKTFELLDALGGAQAEALILSLVRSLCTGRREDLIPEFQAYAPALAAWNKAGGPAPDPDKFRNAGVPKALDLIAQAGGQTQDLFGTLMYASADAMLHFDVARRETYTASISNNVDWLDYTHAITHLSAAREMCEAAPELWRQAFLQTGCFLGRGAKFVDWDQDVSAYGVDDAPGFLQSVLNGMLDHGEPLYIHSSHVLKLATTISREVQRQPEAAYVPVLLAALNRYVSLPVKRKHVRRVAHQAHTFVAGEG
ncbi:MAG: Rieske (2Fe-2S) protein [Alphaproteobacteria bacterium]